MKQDSVSIGDTSIYYKSFGDTNSPKLFILHGWWGSSDSWVECATLLSDHGFHVIVPDLPGFWKTKLSRAFTLEDYADVVEQLVKKLKLNNILLWWHSNGGAIATKICHRNNIEVKHLVLNNSAGIRHDPKRNLKRIILWYLVKVGKLFKNIPGFSYVRNLFYRAIWSHDYLNAEKNKSLAQTYQNMIASDLQDVLPTIQTATTMIWWENDSYTPVSDAQKIDSLLLNSHLIILDWERHGIHLQNPTRLVDTFLKTL